jgi:hypothetical protein
MPCEQTSCPNGFLVRHKCGEMAAVWDYLETGKDLFVQCSCPADPIELCIDLGIRFEDLHPCERPLPAEV